MIKVLFLSPCFYCFFSVVPRLPCRFLLFFTDCFFLLSQELSCRLFCRFKIVFYCLLLFFETRAAIAVHMILFSLLCSPEVSHLSKVTTMASPRFSRMAASWRKEDRFTFTFLNSIFNHFTFIFSTLAQYLIISLLLFLQLCLNI